MKNTDKSNKSKELIPVKSLLKTMKEPWLFKVKTTLTMS